MKLKNMWGYLIPALIIVIAVGAGILTRPSKKKTVVGHIANPSVITQGYFVADTTGRYFLFRLSWDKTGGAAGSIVSTDVVSSCINTTPHLDGTVKWLSDNVFAYIPKKLTTGKYKFTITCIPTSATTKKPISAFIYRVNVIPLSMQVGITSWDEWKLNIKAEFNYPVQMDSVLKYLKVKDEKDNVYQINNPRLEEQKYLYFDIANPHTPHTLYFIANRKMTTYALAGIKNRHQIIDSVFFAFDRKPLVVRSCRVKKNQDTYFLRVNFSSPSGVRSGFDENDAKRYIKFRPAAKFTVSSFKNILFIYPEVTPNTHYTMTIMAGLTAKDGSNLRKEFSWEFDVAKPSPKIMFLAKGRYLGTGGGLKIPLKIRRVYDLVVDVSWIPPKNATFFYAFNNGDKEDFYRYSKDIVRNYVVKGGKAGFDYKMLFLNINDIIDTKKKGIYMITARAKYHDGKDSFRWQRATMSLVVSDISMVAKLANDMIYIWTMNAGNLEPMSHVKLVVKDRNNFVIGRGVSDASGFARIKRDTSCLYPFFILAEQGDKWSYMHLPSSYIHKDQFDVNGENNYLPYKVFMYSQRDLYRPGEKVSITAVIRDKKSFTGVSLPITLKVIDPRGRNILKLAGQTDESGVYSTTFPTFASSPTGKYAVELYVAKRLYYSLFVNVETFVPERMLVKMDLPAVLNPASFTMHLSADYLFGAPASNQPYTVKYFGEEIPMKSPVYPDFTFGIPTKRQGFNWEDIHGRLDKSGKDSIKFSVLKDIDTVMNPVRINFYAEVKEGASGRVTKKQAQKIVHVQPYYIGLKPDKHSYDRGEPVHIDGVVVDRDGKLLTTVNTVYMRLYRRLWWYSYWYDDYEDDYQWEDYNRLIPAAGEQKISVKGGKFNIDFEYPTWDDYVVEVKAPAGPRTRLTLSVWSWWGEQKKLIRPDYLPISLSKTTADEGENVVATCKLPFEGRILWSVELDTIVKYKWASATGSIAKWAFKVPRGMPNVFVSAYLVRSGKDYLIQRAYGVKRLKIRPKRALLPIKITVPQKVKPGAKLNITLSSSSDFEATVSVVDEGILSITDFKTPNPYEGILRNTQLDVGTYETFGWFIRKNISTTGGGMMMKEKSFATARFFTTVTYWSGKRKSKGGKLKLSVQLPSYQGRLRVMVQAFNAKKMAGAEKDVTVSSDVVVMSTMPRFLCTNDTFSIPVNLINTTDKAQNVKLDVKARHIKFKKYRHTLSLSPSQTQVVFVNGIADRYPGTTFVYVNAGFGKGNFSDSFRLPLYPSRPYISKVVTKPVVNKTVQVSPMFKEWIPIAHRADIMLTNLPCLTRFYNLKYLIGYPYGCVEQTSSKMLALLSLSDIIPFVDTSIKKATIDRFVNAGIGKLVMMQSPDGGFSFWPFCNCVYSFPSAYGAFALIESKRLGYYVPESTLKAAMFYLEHYAKNEALTNYVLARGGELQKIPGAVSRLNTYYKRAENNEQRLFLIGAMAASGRINQARTLLMNIIKKNPDFEQFKRWPYYWDYGFYSPVREAALRLYFAEDILTDKKIVDSLAQNVVDILKGQSYYYTTQELVWSLLALGKYIMNNSGSMPPVRLMLSGKELKGTKSKYGVAYHLSNVASLKSLVLHVSDTTRPLYLVAYNQGFSKKNSDFIAKRAGLNTGVNLLTLSGELVSDSTPIRVGDELVVSVFWKSSADRLNNVAIEVPIPAGFDIENPRLKGALLPPRLIARPYNVDYVDVRDDRVILFTSSSAYVTRFYYFLIRANLKGNYFWGPVRAVAMYQPRYYSHGPSGRIKIVGR